MANLAEWAHMLMNPSLLGLIVGALLVLSVPLFLHLLIFKSGQLTSLPSILVIGPSGSGKTALATLFERGRHASTHTSQAPLTVECDLPVGTTAASSQYRSVNDPSTQAYKKFLLVDTPGHGKLRHHALSSITKPQNLKGVIFLVDAASLTTDDETLRITSEYLYDILLLLQKRMADPKISKSTKEFNLLVAANKMDLFTALPAALVKSSLESELQKIRASRSKGILDSGIGISDDADVDENNDWLGEVGSKEFKFSQMQEFGISVEVRGGSVIGAPEPEVEKWWNWIAEQL